MMEATLKKTKVQVYEALKAFMEDRKFHPDDRLPTLQQLARRFDVGMTAVRQAVARLEAEGLLVSRHGSGIYTTTSTIRQMRVGLAGCFDGHLWEDLARELVDALGACPDIIFTMIPLSKDESHETKLARMRHRLRTDRLDVLVVMTYSGFGQHGRVMQAIRDDVKLIEVYGSIGAPDDEPFLQIASGGVLSDIVAGHGMATRHLLDVGCRHILLLSHGGAVPMEQACLSSAGGTGGGAKVHILRSSPTKPDYAANILAYLKEHPEIDGIFGFGDWRIASILPGLRQAGYRVPEDLKLIGYGDTAWSHLVQVPLSTVNTLPRELAQTTSRMIQSGRLTQRHTIQPRLVIRQSSMAGLSQEAQP